MSAHPPFRLPRTGGKARVLLAVTLAVIAFVLLFDWNWLRGPVERHLTDRSGREVRIGDLHIEPGFALQPAIRLRDVYIQNAPWASPRPLLTAGEISFTVSLSSVVRGRPVISRLVLVDATVDMERQADGLRNWRLRNPEDRSPGRTLVRTLETHRSQLHFANRAIDLEFVASAAALDVKNAGTDAGDLSTRIVFEGRYGGRAFSGVALNTGVLSFRESGLSFPLRGHMVSSGTRLEFDGFFTDLFDIGPMDARVKLAGPSLAQLHPFLRVRPPESHPYTVDAHLTQTHDVYRFAQLVGKIGATPLSGEVTYDRSGARPRLEAKLSSSAAALDDLRPLMGMRSARGSAPLRATSGSASGESQGAAGDSAPAGRELLPTRPLRLDAVRATDVQISASLRKLTVAAFPMLQDVRFDASLREGLLELKPFEAEVAGGRINGSLSFDGREDAAATRLSAELRGARVERLLPTLAAKSGSTGALSARVTLSGRGNSVAAIVGKSAGSAAFTLGRGTISNLADAKLGLNFGKVLSVFLRGDRVIAINCGAAVFDVQGGVAQSRKIVLDTQQTHVDGKGSITLRDQRLDLMLTPEPKQPGLFTRRASIRIQGPVSAPAVSLEERVEQAATAHGQC